MSHLPKNISFIVKEDVRLALVETSLREIIYIEISSRYGWLGRDESPAPSAAADLLTYGSKKRDRSEWFTLLDTKRINISLSVDRHLSTVYIAAFKEDVQEALVYAKELLTEYTYPTKEVQQYVEREVTGTKNDMQDPGSVATRSMRHTLYPKEHPNHKYSFAQSLKNLEQMKRAGLLSWMKDFTMSGVCCTVSGDTRGFKTAQLLAFIHSFRNSPAQAFRKYDALDAQKFKDVRTSIAGKGSIDVVLAHHVPVYRDSALFAPLQVCNELLGGSFSSHLMQTVRDRDGLTYRAYSGLRDFDNYTSGILTLAGSFNSHNYEKGKNALITEFATFKKKKLTNEEVALAKENLITGALFSRSSTRGLATVVQYSLEQFGDLRHLTESINRIDAVTLSDINEARKFLCPELLTEFSAGTFKK